MALPLTEQVNPDTEDIDRCGTLAILQKINREDRRVAEAAEKCLEALVPAVEAAAERLARGGRIERSCTVPLSSDSSQRRQVVVNASFQVRSSLGERREYRYQVSGMVPAA